MASILKHVGLVCSTLFRTQDRLLSFHFPLISEGVLSRWVPDLNSMSEPGLPSSEYTVIDVHQNAVADVEKRIILMVGGEGGG